MIDIKDAVSSAIKFVESVYPDGQIRHLRLEEIEADRSNNRWRVTLGWAESAVRDGTLGMGFTAALQAIPRVYKVFDIDGDSGAVLSMKIREVE